MEPEDSELEALVRGFMSRRTSLAGHQKAGTAHMADARLQRLLEKIAKIGPDAVELIIHILEDMEKTNHRLLQNAGTYEMLVSCREFAKVIGMLVKKLKKARNKLKEKEAAEADASENALGEVENGI